MKVCAFGECLIDFTPQGLSEKGNFLYEQNPGGAPANLAVAIARQQGQSVFVGKVGQDLFGDFLVRILKKEGVDTSSVILSHRYRTTLAFVQLQENGERDFSFYRNPGADVAIESREVNFDTLNECGIFHYGSVSMTHNPARQTTFELLEYARRNHKLLTFDPNLRQPLWPNLEEARAQIRKGLEFCDILKVTEEELFFIMEIEDLAQAAEQMRKEYAIPLILITRGQAGCIMKTEHHFISFPGFSVKSVDSTGAGDAFFGSFLASVCRHEHPEQLTVSELSAFVRRANASGALATTVKGAIPSLPTAAQVDEFLEAHRDEGHGQESGT